MATGFNTQVGNGEYRLQFETDNEEHYLLMQETARRCVDGKPVTIADSIRSMNDEELAEFLIDLADDGNLRIREWLQQPADNDKNGV